MGKHSGVVEKLDKLPPSFEESSFAEKVAEVKKQITEESKITPASLADMYRKARIKKDTVSEELSRNQRRSDSSRTTHLFGLRTGRTVISEIGGRIERLYANGAIREDRRSGGVPQVVPRARIGRTDDSSVAICQNITTLAENVT